MSPLLEVGDLHVRYRAPARMTELIPGRARLSIELRDLSSQKLAAIMDDIRARAGEIAASTRTTIEFTRAMAAEAAVATPEVQQAIERAAESLRLSAARLPSGAGHDAQNMAIIGPMGMIFVPSVGGVSHAPEETTDPEHLVLGAQVLADTLVALDGRGVG